MTIKENGYIVLVGHAGSGRSTLFRHSNVLVEPTNGIVHIEERDIQPDTDNENLKPIRERVGIIFQFLEAQLFEETATEDIALGSKNSDVSEEGALILAKETLEQVGLDEGHLDRLPFELSGEQIRRAAVAGVPTMRPEILVLDGPTAGPDPQGRKEMMGIFWHPRREQQVTTVLVTHLMDDVVNFADYIYTLEKGRIVNSGQPQEVFQSIKRLKERRLGVPTATEFAEELMAKRMDFTTLPLTAEELADAIIHPAGGNTHDE